MQNRQLIFLVFALFSIISCDAETPTGEGIEQLPAHRLIFISDRDIDKNLEVFTLDTKGVFKQLTDDAQYDCHWPRPSPDGSSILFYRQAENDGRQDYKQFVLWTMDANGDNESVLLPQGSHEWNSQGVVDWSPDGTQLVMAGETDNWNLYVTDTDGNSPVRISERDGLYLDPSWSPDGSRIVYTAIPAEQEISIFDLANVFTYLEIFTADADGGNEVRHTFDDLRDHDPYFSPDGNEISFESQNGGFLSLDWDTRVVNQSSNQARILAKNGTVPRWAPDGNMLYFYGLEFTPTLRRWHLQSVSKDGLNRTRITDGLIYSDSEVDIF